MSDLPPHRPRRSRGGVVPDQVPAAESTTRRRKSRRIVIVILAILALIVTVALVVGGMFLNRLQNTFEDHRNVIDDLQELDDETSYRTPEGTINILLLGSDSRGDSEEEYRAETGEAGERSDAIMLVHIPADRSGAYVMSIMRDLWVDVPGMGPGRVNSALNAGGLDLAVETVEEMLYTHIDHVVTIDFEGFSDLTEALGGVYVDNPRSFSAGQRNPDFYPEGTVRLEGDAALRFVRERKSFPQGDHIRVENQQLVVRAIAERFLSGDTLTNPQRILDVLEAILPFMSMDAGLDSNSLVGYGLELRNLRSSDIEMFTMPVGEQFVTSGGAQVLLPNEPMLERLREDLGNDDVGAFVDYLNGLEQQEGQPLEPSEAETIPEDDPLLQDTSTP